MAYQMACKETGANCPFNVTCETKEELMQHVAIHAKTSHPEMANKPMPPEMMEKLIHVV